MMAGIGITVIAAAAIRIVFVDEARDSQWSQVDASMEMVLIVSTRRLLSPSLPCCSPRRLYPFLSASSWRKHWPLPTVAMNIDAYDAPFIMRGSVGNCGGDAAW